MNTCFEKDLPPGLIEDLVAVLMKHYAGDKHCENCKTDPAVIAEEFEFGLKFPLEGEETVEAYVDRDLSEVQRIGELIGRTNPLEAFTAQAVGSTLGHALRHCQWK